MEKVRTRFAPSPTGYMHIGNLRTAIYEYLIAKVNNGEFILRIEDTDQNRVVDGAVDIIYKTLKSVGLDYNEGPDIGGQYGPYIQSQRKTIYKEYAAKLIKNGGAYYCFCSKERLDQLKAELDSKGLPYKYDGHCKHLSKMEIEKNLAENLPHVVRQNIPSEGITSFSDLVFGEVTVNNSELDENVLIKSDGLPTYNFANVVDDHLMEISHVVRGSEYLSSTPKYNLLYKSFGWSIPKYVHLPPIMKSQGKKLSKREGDASFEDFINKGYLPEAIVNYIVLLGWSPGNNAEFFTLDDLKRSFTIEDLSKSPAIFDETKLKWMNSEYIRKLPDQEFHRLAAPYYETLAGKGYSLENISKMIQPRVSILSEIPELIGFLIEMPEYNVSLYTNKKAKSDLATSISVLSKSRECTAKSEEWTNANIYKMLVEIGAELGLKNNQVFWPIRIAISGKEVTPGGATEIAEILGVNEFIKRVSLGISKLEKAMEPR